MKQQRIRGALIAVAVAAGAAPSSAQVTGSAPRLALDHVGIQVFDLARSIAFYTNVLGLREVQSPFPKDAARWIDLGGGRMLHVVAGGKRDAVRNRWDHFALACADLDALIARLDRLKVEWTDMDGKRSVQTRPDRIRQIFVRDPDGYYIEINDAKTVA